MLFLHRRSSSSFVKIIVSIIIGAICIFSSTCLAEKDTLVKIEQQECPVAKYDHHDDVDPIAKYHADTSCDRTNFNTFRHRLDRGMTQRALRRIGVSRVADEKTVYCPQQDTMEDLRYASPTKKYTLTGFKSMWLVENTASTPVVVAWINPNSGKEYSAANSQITPPTLDPNAMIPPGQFKFYLAAESHVFHVRAVLEDGTMGEVLLQHRHGLIPITNRFGPPDLSCDPKDKKKKKKKDKKNSTTAEEKEDDTVVSEDEEDELLEIAEVIEDIEPMIVVTTETENKSNKKEVKKKDPEYHRDSDPTPLCNVMDVGFRNRVGCPLNAYFVLGGKPKNNNNETVVAANNNNNGQEQATIDNNETSTTVSQYPKPPPNERFQFHLGTNPNSPNFVCDWVSQTKWEGTYVGHYFIFRLANNPSILIDEVSIQPTLVPDCPAIRKKKQQAKLQTMVDPMGVLHYIPVNETTKTKSALPRMLKFNDTTYAPTNHFFSALSWTH